MSAAADIMLRAARACLGTPFHHQGRMPHGGLDCIGLVVVALRAAGYAVRDVQDYDRLPRGETLRVALLAHGAQRVARAEPGDVLLFAFMGRAQHVALCSGTETMIHAYAGAGAVVETALNAAWRRRCCGIFRFEG